MDSHTRRDFALRTAGLAISVSAAVQAQPVPSVPKGPWTKEGDVQRGGTRIHYAEMGSGPPVILLHKLGGWIADWRHIAPALSKSYRVIAIDMPGHGDSMINGPAPFLQSLPESAAVLLAAIDDLKIDRFDIVGSSLGATCGIVMAGLWPERIKHLAMIGAALNPGVKREDLEKAVEPPGQWDAKGLPIPRSFEGAMDRAGISDRAIHDEQNASRAKAGAWVLPSQRGVAAAAVASYLPRITAPTLLIYGENGGYKNYEAVAKAKVKRIRTVTVPGAGSFTYQDRPRETEALLLPFLAQPI